MKIIGNEPINARPYSHDERPSGGCEGDRPETFQAFTGLTIRQYFAAMAMQGMCANSNLHNSYDNTALCAVKQADALIAEFNKE